MPRGAGAAEESCVSTPSFRFRRAALAAAILCAIPFARADEPAESLDEVVVTATRTAQTQDQTLAAITVIDRADIDRLQPMTLMDLLRGTPGLSLANSGGIGKQTSVFLRGAESGHVLVLVDGMKIGSATAGLASFQDIPVEQIERIEIVRGPFSSLYGSEAIGGVIQIFTRRAQGGFAPNASFGAGSHSTQRAAVGAAGSGERGWYSVEASHDRTDGINSCRGRPFPDGAGCYTDEPDRDGYRNSALSLQGGYRFADAWDASVQAFRAEGDNHYDSTVSNSSDVVSQVVGGRLHYRPSEALSLTLGLGQSADLSTDYLDGDYVSRFDTRRDLGTLQGDLAVGGGLLSLGYDWQRDRVGSSLPYDIDRRIDSGVFAQWQQGFGTQSLQLNVRHDENGQFGGKTTGSALWGWDFAEGLRLTASAGSAFKAPTFNDLYYPGYGNPDLKPETSRNLELGLRGKAAWGGWSLSAYHDKVSNLIAYDPTLIDDQHPYGGPNNVERARIRGVEASADTTLAGWTLRASATWLDAVNEGAYRGNELPRRARLSGRIDADRGFGPFAVGASVYAAGKRYDDLANTTVLGGYSLADLRIAWTFAPTWKLQLAANNVFDKRYETAAFYNQLGRTFMLTARWQPSRD